MTRPKNVNTVSVDTQAKNITLPSLQLNTVRQHIGDVEDQALTTQTLAEIAFEIIDGIVPTDEATLQAVTRLDALFKSAYRAAIVIQESAVAISLALEEVEGGAQ